MAQTKIVKCDCKSDFQDKEYGKSQRLMNQASAKGSQPKRFRCTVCSKTHNT